jgi:hypothetical protein
MGLYFRLQRDLVEAYTAPPTSDGRIERLTDELAAIQRIIRGEMQRDEQTSDSTIPGALADPIGRGAAQLDAGTGAGLLQHDLPIDRQAQRTRSSTSVSREHVAPAHRRAPEPMPAGRAGEADHGARQPLELAQVGRDLGVERGDAPALETDLPRGIDDVVDELKALERHALGDQLCGEGLVLRKVSAGESGSRRTG